ncbi:MAG: SLBB domain-containing protein [Pseudomonadota bacterium]
MPKSTFLSGLVLLATALFATDIANAQSTNERYQALKNAPLTTDLPVANDGLGSMEMPAGGDITYPTLRLDVREPRKVQSPTEAPKLELPAPSESPFHRLVEQTLGFKLPVYGASLFADASRGFDPVTDIAVPDDFVLDSGDEVYIRAWGSIDLDVRVTIDRNGVISLPKVGEIPLRGVRYGELKSHLEAAIGRAFHSFELSVAMGQLRSVRVYVTGFARVPGSYTVSALSTPMNVLFYAGGPDAAGDLRRIQWLRDGEVLLEADFYEFLNAGQFKHSLRMRTGDVLHLQPMHGEVALAGAINRQGIYQLAKGETLAQLLAHGGGLSVVATKHRIVMERISTDGQRVVEEFVLDEAALQRPLQKGDLVLVQPISPQFQNAVTLRGHVAQPLRHEWRDGMRLSDLLPDAEALISPNYWIRRNEQRQVAELITTAADTGLRIDFPDINWEYAVIERTNPNTLRTSLIPFRLGDVVNQRNPIEDHLLQPGDRVTVFSLKDFRVRRDATRRFVRIEGEVARAGVYPVGPNDTIEDALRMAGGLTDAAYLYGLEMSRTSIRERQRKRIDESIDQLEQDYYRHLIERSRNVLTGDLTHSIMPEAAAIRGLIEQLRESEPNGRIVLELDDEITSTSALPRLNLEDGDVLHVPSVPPTIEVVGAVYRQGSFIYNGTKLKGYLQNAGLLEVADTRNVYVIRPDGSFRQVTRGLRIRPGDTVIVPEEVDRERTVRRIKDWTQVLYQLGLGAAGLNLLEVF